jgi:hypothetical protein
MRSKRWLSYFVIALFLVVGRNAAFSQHSKLFPNPLSSFVSGPQEPATFSLISDREPVVSLTGYWRFHTGDDPRWSEASFDDSAWPLLRSDQPWSEQGYKNLSGFAWYRFTIEAPSPAIPLAILLPSILTSYEVYDDGQKIGGFGQMPPHGTLRFNQRFLYRLPPASPGARIHIAIRVWHHPMFASYLGGGPRYGDALAGNAILLERQLLLYQAERSTNIVSFFAVCILDAVVGFTVLGLYLFRTSEREYLWFAILLLADALLTTVVLVDFYLNFPLAARDFAAESFGAIWFAASLFFFSRVLEAKRSLLWHVVLILAIVNPLNVVLYAAGVTSLATSTSLRVLFALPIKLWIIALLFRRALAGSRNARLLVIPTVLLYGSQLLGGLLILLVQLGWQKRLVSSISQWNVLNKPFPIQLGALVQVIFVAALLAFLIRRFAGSRAREERFTADLEAVRTLQQLLIPESLPALPGLSIETAYHPAQEVGGDFFQVLTSAPQGSSGSPAATLIVLGDVAGKGLPAAMTVSLLVGALRSLAESSVSPASLLAGLNRRLSGRGTGFTTCLILSVSPTGNLTVANAGHPAPYRNGKEISSPPALPLGLDPDATFPEEVIELVIGDRITLISDGIPEAMRQRELFGFARTEKLSMEPASTIAEAAINFGQNDDITVVTVVVSALPLAY